MNKKWIGWIVTIPVTGAYALGYIPANVFTWFVVGSVMLSFYYAGIDKGRES